VRISIAGVCELHAVMVPAPTRFLAPKTACISRSSERRPGSFIE